MKLICGVVGIMLVGASGFLLGRGHLPRPAGAPAAHRVLYWVDPMHPAYRSDHPGIAPDCGMPLEPVYADSSLTAGSVSGHPTVLGVSETKGAIKSLNVATVTVSRGAAGIEYYRLPGRVVADETNVYKVNAGVDGFVKETHDDAAGNFVKKDQRLAVIYSPEFLTIFGGYLSASERTQNTSPKEELAATQGTIGLQNWSDRLRNLGVSDAQIAEVRQTRKIPEDVYVVSPVNGFILSRNIAADQRFERHAEFYRLADLRRVWIMTDVTLEQAESLRPGSLARVIGPDLKTTFSARISNVLPQIDAATRIARLRLESDNPAFALRPEMLVEVELARRAPAGLSVPREAVLDSGLEQQVFVEVAKGIFEPRKVETGWRFKDRVQVVRGLAEGERVAGTVSFAVDSEARLKTVAVGIKNEEKDRSRARGDARSLSAYRGNRNEQNIDHAREHHPDLSPGGGQP